MAIINSPAVILRRVNHSETSLICTFYTREYGKLTAIAKGARRQKSQFAGLLDLMNYLDIVVYTKESREVQTLSSAEFIKPFLNIQRDMERTGVGMILVETVRQAIIGEEPHPEVFDMLISVLEVLNSREIAGIELVWWFHLHLASQLGFQPRFTHCYECGKSLTGGYFSADNGQMHCGDCVIRQPGMVSLNHLEIRLLGYLTRQELGDLDSEAIHRTFPSSASEDDRRRQIHPEIITEMIVRYLRYHVEGITTLRSLDFFATLN